MTEFILVAAEISSGKKVLKAAGIVETKKNETVFDFINRFYQERKFSILNKSFVLSHSLNGYLLTVNNHAQGETYRYLFTIVNLENSQTVIESLSEKERKRDAKAIEKLKDLK